MTRQDNPKEGELVVCEITNINPNSAYARLVEYNRTGMIHVSEVARRWVRDIREFVKDGQIVVCKVLRADDAYISLSIKRVDRGQSDRKLQDFKKERNTEKLLEQLGKSLGLNLEQTYDAVGNALQEEFGSLYKAFEIALKNPDLLTEKGIEKKWADAITDVARKNYVPKVFEIKADLTMFSLAPDGVGLIKGLLSGMAGKGFEVHYLAAAKYQIIAKGDNVKDVQTRLESACQEAIEGAEKAGGEGSFALPER